MQIVKAEWSSLMPPGGKELHSKTLFFFSVRLSEQLKVELSKGDDPSKKQLCNSPPRSHPEKSRDVGHHPESKPTGASSMANPCKGTMDTCSEDEELLLTDLFTIPSWYYTAQIRYWCHAMQAFRYGFCPLALEENWSCKTKIWKRKPSGLRVCFLFCHLSLFML